MSQTTEDPLDCNAKVSFLMRNPAAVRVLGHRPNELGLCEVTGIKRNTLRDQLGKGRLSSDVQQALAKAFKFSLAWPEWATGKADAFIDRFKREHDLNTPHAPARIVDPDARLRTVLLQPPGDENASDQTLASVDLRLNQANAGAKWEVSMDLICQPAPFGDGSIEVVVKRGLLELSPGPAGIDREAGWLAADGAEKFPRGKDEEARTIVVRTANRRTAGNPTWDISSEGEGIGSCDEKGIGVFRLDDDKPLCRLDTPATGDDITVRFKVWVRDLDFVEPDPDDDTDDGDTLRSFLRPDGKPLSAMKRAMIKALLIKEELAPHEDGWVTVAQAGRRFEVDA